MVAITKVILKFEPMIKRPKTTNHAKVLLQSKFCLKYHKSKYSLMIFYLMKYYHNQNLQI